MGQIVELTDKAELFQNPLHPYTEALLSAVAGLRPGGGGRILLNGDVPSPLNPPAGCRFHTRCHRVMDICLKAEPQFREIVTGHYAACHLFP
jgi:oligopeptide/dipeptide ABC transporter ATP-binding protein